MKWFLIILILIMNIRSAEDLYEIKKEYFLKNTFRYEKSIQFKSFEGYLSLVDICVECKDGQTCYYHFYKESCYSLRSTDFGYILLDSEMLENISYVLKSSINDKSLLKLRFFITGEQINNSFKYKKYKEKVQEFAIYKSLKRDPKNENYIDFICNENENRIENINNKFEELIWMNPLKLDEYINFFEEIEKYRKIEDCADFYLNFFTNHSLCLEKLKGLVEDLSCFKLKEDSFLNTSCYKKSVDRTTTLMVSEFKMHLRKKFKNLLNFYNINFDESWETLFNDCLKHIKYVMLNKNIFLPIGGKFDINYYIDQLSKLIYESIKKERIRYYTFDLNRKELIFSEIIISLQCGLEKLQTIAMKHLYNYKYICSHFCKMLEKKIEPTNDNFEIEKMLCDCYNMFVFIFNFYRKTLFKRPYFYVSPILRDDNYYDMSIIDGIKIKYKNSVKFSKIIGFNEKEEDIIMFQDIDYFINEFNDLYCTSDVLKSKNIMKIKIIPSDNEKNSITLEATNKTDN